MIPARAHPAIRYPGEKFQQVTARIRYRDRHDRRCRCGRGSINDRLTHDEAPVAGICERTPVPTGASLPSTARRAVHDHIATPATNRDSNPQNDLGTAVMIQADGPIAPAAPQFGTTGAAVPVSCPTGRSMPGTR